MANELDLKGKKLVCSLFCYYEESENQTHIEDIVILFVIKLIVVGFCFIIFQCCQKILCESQRSGDNSNIIELTYY